MKFKSLLLRQEEPSYPCRIGRFLCILQTPLPKAGQGSYVGTGLFPIYFKEKVCAAGRKLRRRFFSCAAGGRRITAPPGLCVPVFGTGPV